MLKKNTLEPSQWDNAELEAMPTREIARTETDRQIVNGVRLFSLKAVNALLASIYAQAGVEDGYRFPAQ